MCLTTLRGTAASPTHGGAPLGSSAPGGPRASPTIQGSAIWTFPARCPTLGSSIRCPVLSPPRGTIRVSTHWGTRRWVSIGRRYYVFPNVGRRAIGTLPNQSSKLKLSVQGSIPNLPGKLSLVPTTRPLHSLEKRHWVLRRQVFQDK